jgi:hypothetical protein
MKKTIISGFATLALLTGSIASASAADVSGYASIWTNLSSNATSTTSGSTTELKTSVGAEVDFEKTMGKSNVRLDVDLKDATSTDTDIVTIEQAKFTQGFHSNLSLTAGRFNSPIGFEKQDSPDKWQFSNGQLFAGRPANLDGLMVSWWGGPATVDVILANDWEGQAASTADFDNSIGVRGSVKAGPVSVALGYLTSEPAMATSTGDLFNVVLLGTQGPITGVFEYHSDEVKDGWGLTGNYAHGKHGVTLRYDSVELETPAAPGADAKTTLTLGVSCKTWELVTTKLEWKQTDLGGVADKKTDELTLQWVGTF